MDLKQTNDISHVQGNLADKAQIFETLRTQIRIDEKNSFLDREKCCRFI